MAKMWNLLICACAVSVSPIAAQLTNTALTVDANPRLITNFSSVLPADLLSAIATPSFSSPVGNVTADTLGIAVYVAGAIFLAGALTISAYFIANQISPLSSIIGTSRSDYYHYRNTREAEYPSYDMMTFVSVISELYDRLNHYDEECQKQIICKTMEDPEIFGNSANKIKYGLTFASSFLSYWGIPYVADIAKAATLDPADFRSCEERFPKCLDVSLKGTYEKSVERVRAANRMVEEMAQQEAYEEWQRSFKGDQY